jgi:hypothetical protein
MLNVKPVRFGVPLARSRKTVGEEGLADPLLCFELDVAAEQPDAATDVTSIRRAVIPANQLEQIRLRIEVLLSIPLSNGLPHRPKLWDAERRT